MLHIIIPSCTWHGQTMPKQGSGNALSWSVSWTLRSANKVCMASVWVPAQVVQVRLAFAVLEATFSCPFLARHSFGHLPFAALWKSLKQTLPSPCKYYETRTHQRGYGQPRIFICALSWSSCKDENWQDVTSSLDRACLFKALKLVTSRPRESWSTKSLRE